MQRSLQESEETQLQGAKGERDSEIQFIFFTGYCNRVQFEHNQVGQIYRADNNIYLRFFFSLTCTLLYKFTQT